MLREFKQFLLRGNVVDLAVGVVMGAAFGTLVTALVSDLITPLISSIAKVPDFGGAFLILHGSKFMYGHLVNAVVSFLLVSFTVFFFIVKPMNVLIARSRTQETPADPTTRKCPECLSEIPLEAARCAHCGQLVEPAQHTTNIS